MPPDPILLTETWNWLSKAKEDMDVAELLAAHSPPMISGATFHVQQAAEKVMKAFLTWHDVPFQKNHDLGALGLACTELDSSLGEASDKVAPLTPWAIWSRYPGNWNLPSQSVLSEAMANVRQLFDQILSRLPQETRR